MSEPMKTEEPTIDAASRDGITIGLIDAMISIAQALNARLASEARRMKRSRIEWEWFLDEVQVALADLAYNGHILKLIRPRDEESMALIHRAAKLIETSNARS